METKFDDFHFSCMGYKARIEYMIQLIEEQKPISKKVQEYWYFAFETLVLKSQMSNKLLDRLFTEPLNENKIRLVFSNLALSPNHTPTRRRYYA